MRSQNVGFSSTKIPALSDVYTDTYDDGVVLHCFMFIFLCDCILIVLDNFCMYVCYMF